MAYFPAHCDNTCKGCEMNKSGWCIWKDTQVNYLSATTAMSELESSSNSITYNQIIKK